MNPNEYSPREQLESSNGDNEKNELTILTEERPTASNTIEMPQITFSESGRILNETEEKIEVNTSNRSAGLIIPLPITLERNIFSPSLSLSYNSGGGNSPYGLVWSIGYPMIQRITVKKLPIYKTTWKNMILCLWNRRFGAIFRSGWQLELSSIRIDELGRDFNNLFSTYFRKNNLIYLLKRMTVLSKSLKGIFVSIHENIITNKIALRKMKLYRVIFCRKHYAI